MPSIRLTKVKITRDTHVIVEDVKAYEVPILIALHGEDRCVVEEEDVGSIDIELSPEDEYSRLMNLYERRSAGVVPFVFRSVKELAAAMSDSSVAPKKAKAVDVDAVAPAKKKVVRKKAASK